MKKQYEVQYWGESTGNPKSKYFETLAQAEEEFSSFPLYDRAHVETYIQGHNNQDDNILSLYENEIDADGEVMGSKAIRTGYVNLNECENPEDRF